MQPSFWDVIATPKRFPALFKYRKATLQEVMDRHLTEPRLKSVFAAQWPNLALPPSKLSFLYWSLMLTSFVEEGAFYCQGGFQNLVDAIVEALEKNGGELLLRSRVRRILVRDRQAAGVVLENGQRIRAPLVISNADAMQTFEELVGIEHLQARFVEKMRRMRPSLSAFVVYTATDLDLREAGAQHYMFRYRTWNHDENYESILAGLPSATTVTVPTLLDSSLAPPGEHTVTAFTLVPYEIGASWRQEKDRYVDLLLREIDMVFPSFRDHVLFAEGASPRTMERYTLNLGGAMLGWEASPEQMGRNRPANQTPVGGLYLAGQWAQPVGTVHGAIVSGLQVAQIILGYSNQGDLFRDLKS